MRNPRRVVAACGAAVLLLLTAMAPTACAGMAARQDALPTISAAYDTIVQPVLLVGIGAEQDAGRLDAEKAELARAAVSTLGDLLRGGDINQAAAMRAAWDRLLPLAVAGIDARVARGEIGPGVAASLKETVRLFGERLIQLAAGQ